LRLHFQLDAFGHDHRAAVSIAPGVQFPNDGKARADALGTHADLDEVPAGDGRIIEAALRAIVVIERNQQPARLEGPDGPRRVVAVEIDFLVELHHHTPAGADAGGLAGPAQVFAQQVGVRQDRL
jgi:hypothetical protein